jgi:hypothetical protein
MYFLNYHAIVGNNTIFFYRIGNDILQLNYMLIVTKSKKRKIQIIRSCCLEISQDHHQVNPLK